MKALILKGKVVDLAENEFPVHKSMKWVDVDDTVKVGYNYKNGKATKPAVPAKTWQQKRRDEYVAKGWRNPYDFIDDILDRGLDAVKADRDAIRVAHPKT